MSCSQDDKCGREWFELAFGHCYLDVYARRNCGSAEREAAFAAEVLDLKPGSRVLDLCCGQGHHLVALRAKGIACVGVDLSPELLALASSRGPVARCDMRSVPYAGPFDAVVTFFTTIGYFDDEGNAATASEIARLLAPGGKFLVDYLNPARVHSSLVPESVREVNGRTIRETRSIDGTPPRIRKRVQIEATDDCEALEYTESVRLYEGGDLAALLGAAGLEIDSVHGDFDGSPCTDESPRMIIVGHLAGGTPRTPWKGGRTVFQQISVNGDRNFAYLFGDGGEAAVVDPTVPSSVIAAAKEASVTIKYIINTHGHYDHTEGNIEMKAATGAEVIAGESAEMPKDIAAKGGEKFTLGATEFEILPTPGHTPDSLCILWEGRLMTGDTLFVGKVGGTGLGDDARAEYASLHDVLMKLPDATEVWPGHDYGAEPSSSIGRERETNPFLKQPTFEAFIDLKQNWAAYKREHGIK
jgi:glyoxylase-like metal-dependent hydrolase (beta-lactamase superfamily II)/SAM-dependent methyltransferase